MANTLLHKRSSTAGATPSAGSLTVGELAINTADGKVVTQKDDASVVEIGAGGGGGASALESVTILAAYEMGVI